jgi:hypothetical protein
MPDSTLLGNIPDYVAAVGALGVAAFGMVEALGKTLFVFPIPGTHIRLGLPYVGFNRIEDLLKKVAPAMEASYGKDFRTILRQQYRAGRSQGQAPESIRQGVRLGLPFLSHAAAVSVIEAIWGLPAGAAAADGAPALALPPAVMVDQALAARFATALDTRVKAAFDLADQVYQTRAQFWAGAIAIGLSLGYHYYTADPKESADPKGWAIALLIGLVAVPLAPAAKDLSSSLSGALAALGSLRPGSK